MSTVLVILGKETSEFAKGQFNQGLFDAAVETLSRDHLVLTTIVEDGYDVDDEIAKYKQADIIVYQYPVYWFMMPPTLKRYIDQVWAYGAFFRFTDGPYGTGGSMIGKQFLLSTTWNAPTDAFDQTDGFFGGLSVNDVLLPIRASHRYCGFEELSHISHHDVIKTPDFALARRRFVDHLNRVLPVPMIKTVAA